MLQISFIPTERMLFVSHIHADSVTFPISTEVEKVSMKVHSLYENSVAIFNCMLINVAFVPSLKSDLQRQIYCCFHKQFIMQDHRKSWGLKDVY